MQSELPQVFCAHAGFLSPRPLHSEAATQVRTHSPETVVPAPASRPVLQRSQVWGLPQSEDFVQR